MSIPSSALLVDDEAHIRLFLKMILKEIGVETIHEAQNGIQALEVYRKTPTDIILMDVNMAGMDGLQTLEKFSQEFPNAFIIMVTSTATREIVEKCITKGAKQYIRKDTPKQDIKKILSETFQEFNNQSPNT